MELIRITDQKLKIMLTPSDITQLDFNQDDPEHCPPFAVRRLLRELRKRFGVELDDSRISVQYFPSKGGGGELFISGAGASKSPQLSKPSDRPTSSFRWEGAYRLNRFSDLLAVCRRLSDAAFEGESAVYHDGHRAYFLLLRTSAAAPFRVPLELAFLNEYGKSENPALLRLYIGEHGHLIRSPDAVAILAGLA